MRTLSTTYLNAAKAAGRYPNLYAVIHGTEDNLTISGKDAIISANIVKGDTAKPAYFEVGRAISGNATIVVDRRRIADESYIVSGAKIEIFAEFDAPSGTAIASAILATMYISGYDNQDREIGYIYMVDHFVYAGGDFNPDNLTYPLSCSGLLTAAFSQAGMPNITMTLPCDPNVKSAPYKASEPVADGMSGDPYTCRDIIGKIAGMQMSDIFIDATGAPKIYGYGNYITTAVTDEIILEQRVSAEVYQIYQVLVYKTDERMIKDEAHFQRLPYSPRFENMDDVGRGSDWWDEIVARADVFVRKDWTTAAVTIAGVGELELGDFVLCGTAEIPIFVSGIVYHFENAHFTETLYSYAYTLEEYYQAPTKSTVVTTDHTSGGSGTGGNHFFGTTAPGVTPSGTDGDYWVVFSGEPETGLTNVTKVYKMVSSSWQEQTFTVASQSTPQPANPDYGDLYVIPSSGDGKSVGQILEYVHFNYDSSATPPFDWTGRDYSAWLPFYPTDNNGVSHDCNTSAGGAAENGDIWFKTTSASNNIILAIYERVNGNWLEQGTFESRGVGKNVGNHNEVFNDYSNNIINTSSSWNDYNHLEGHDNTATNSTGAHIEGHDNVISGASNTHVGGYGNSVGTNSGASDCFVHGEENTVDGLASAAVGAFNVIKRGDHSFAVGKGNSTGAYGIALGHHNNSLKNGGTSGGYVVLLGGYLDTDGYNDVIMLGDHCTATESNQFVYGTGVGNGNLLTVDYHGNVAATAFNPTGADYAEYFEWSDGNPDSEDRRGLLVSLDGDKISLANGDDILGIVSAAPSVTGNSAAIGWHGRYKTDVFGVPIRDEEGKPILSDDYDRDVQYIPRSKRPEWAAIGLVGRLIVCDNGKCTVGGYVSARNGVAVPTRTKTNVRVLRRVDDTHIEVLIR